MGRDEDWGQGNANKFPAEELERIYRESGGGDIRIRGDALNQILNTQKVFEEGVVRRHRARGRKTMMKATIDVDTSQLDVALQKMDQLIAKARQVQQLGVPVAAGAFMLTSTIVASTKKVTRRRLLGLGWRR